MKKYLILGLFFVVAACSSKDKYDVSKYYNAKEQDVILAGIITYIFEAPPYTLMKDRFMDQHKKHYLSLTPKFSLEKFYVAEDGTHYFYVLRPGRNSEEKRGVGGHFRMNNNLEIVDFREVFVTPRFGIKEIKERTIFLFDDMVKGTVEKDLPMETYVQWPNPGSYYDTVAYEWKLRPDMK